MQRWSLPDGWVISRKTRPPGAGQRGRFHPCPGHQRRPRPRPSVGLTVPRHRYLLAGLVADGGCGRRMESTWSNGTAARPPAGPAMVGSRLRRPERPVDRQAQGIAVEPAAAAQVAGQHQDPAVQSVHATISPPRQVTRDAEITRAEPPNWAAGQVGRTGCVDARERPIRIGLSMRRGQS
jgi:hypothetical protein